MWGEFVVHLYKKIQIIIIIKKTLKNDFENLLQVQLFLGCNIWENIEKT